MYWLWILAILFLEYKIVAKQKATILGAVIVNQFLWEVHPEP